ncbi:WAT1-related protein [Senna tora]|uniref:WAT1-related protein n=1 Tax=Senna tora TaxID=362788 RepID=A0A834WH56_9FABA|nr:WAT1-related protein [Senna tora]
MNNEDMSNFIRPVVDQGFTLLGMQYTSATLASATQNAVPSITFILAVIFRVERVNMKEVGSKAKVIGTVVTFGGALLMTFYKGPVINLFHQYSANTSTVMSMRQQHEHKEWLIGTLFLLLGCLAWSSFFILQSITLNKYPPPISLACFICFLGSLQSGALALVFQHHSAAWSLAKEEDHSHLTTESTHNLPITNTSTHISKLDSNAAAKPIYHQPTN